MKGSRMTTNEKPSERAARVAGHIAAYRKLVLPFPPQQELFGDMDELRIIGRETKGEMQDALLVLHPTHTGKTTTAKLFAERANNQLPAGSDSKPVVIARCAAVGTSRALACSLFEGAGLRYNFGATEDALWKAWKGVVERYAVELVVIDEVQHCQDSKFGSSVTNTLKNRLSDGPPLVLMGTRKGEAVFSTNDEFNSRTYAPVSLKPQEWHNQDDRALWIGFCANLDHAMVEQGIVAGQSDLGGVYSERLCEAALGRIGLLKKIVQTALRLALHRGAEVIDLADLRKAVEIWAIKNRFISYNPFGALA